MQTIIYACGHMGYVPIGPDKTIHVPKECSLCIRIAAKRNATRNERGTTMARVTDYELIGHGIEHSQYFRGCGVFGTPYKHAVTGMGDNPAEAIEDCLEQVAQGGFAAEDLETRILADEGWESFPTTPSVSERFPVDGDGDEWEGDCELHYRVSIRFNVAD